MQHQIRRSKPIEIPKFEENKKVTWTITLPSIPVMAFIIVWLFS